MDAKALQRKRRNGRRSLTSLLNEASSLTETFAETLTTNQLNRIDELINDLEAQLKRLEDIDDQLLIAIPEERDDFAEQSADYIDEHRLRIRNIRVHRKDNKAWHPPPGVWKPPTTRVPATTPSTAMRNEKQAGESPTTNERPSSEAYTTTSERPPAPNPEKPSEAIRECTAGATNNTVEPITEATNRECPARATILTTCTSASEEPEANRECPTMATITTTATETEQTTKETNNQITNRNGKTTSDETKEDDNMMTTPIRTGHDETENMNISSEKTTDNSQTTSSESSELTYTPDGQFSHDYSKIHVDNILLINMLYPLLLTYVFKQISYLQKFDVVRTQNSLPSCFNKCLMDVT